MTSYRAELRLIANSLDEITGDEGSCRGTGPVIVLLGEGMDPRDIDLKRTYQKNPDFPGHEIDEYIRGKYPNHNIVNRP